ncbi:hypothetical protein [Sphingomonas profundi]|uniref:hypothetical protein n=1 Tax=Alterirhizorhabdus profundi TaxID=2681549 RepID=UPI0012E7DFC0|nr:hypothetical protein [Sphingomonas profundi]
MVASYWKLGLTLAAGVALGTVAGQATIAGMAPPIAPRTSLPDRLDAPAEGEVYGPDRYADANPDLADQARIADACEDCSDYDLGYRFAAARHLRTTADCMDYSWSYQRGCLAYLREG